MKAIKRRGGGLLVLALLTTLAVARPGSAAPGDPSAGFGTDGRVLTDGGLVLDGGTGALLAVPGGDTIAAGTAYHDVTVSLWVDAVAADGTLDPSFGTGGIATIPFTGLGAPRPAAIARQADGKLVVAGSTDATYPDSTNTFVARFTASGTPDVSFGAGGVATFNLGSNDKPTTVAVQSTGRIIIGATLGVTKAGIVVGLTATGALDATFGTSGVAHPADVRDAFFAFVTSDDHVVYATTKASAFVGVARRLNANGTADATFGTGGECLLRDSFFFTPHVEPTAAQLIGDDVVAVGGAHYVRVNTSGFVQSLTTTGLDNISALAVAPAGKVVAIAPKTVARLDAGAPDATFATNGVLTVSEPKLGFATSVAVGSDGAITIGTAQYPVVGRITAAGAFDPSFDGDGIAPVGVVVHADDGAVAVLAQPDGGVLLAGATARRPMAVKLDATGAPEPAFDGDGVARPPVLPEAIFFTLAAARGPSGSTVFAGTTDRGSVAFRLLADGSLDATFGSGGVVALAANLSVASITGLVDGSVVIGAAIRPPGIGGSSNWMLVKLTSAGTPDAAFAGGGYDEVDLGGYDQITATAVDGSGRILVIGPSSTLARGVLARFTGAGALDPSFAGDGTFTLPNGNDSTAIGFSALAIAPDGNVLVAGGRCFEPALDCPHTGAAILRFNQAGTLDPTFNGNGIVEPVIDGVARFGAGSVAVQGDGSVVFSGVADSGVNGSTGTIMVGRLRADGSEDGSFSGDGLASTPTVPVRPGGFTYTPVAITTGGTVVVGGTATGPDSEDLLAAAFDGGTAAPITTRFVPLTPSRILDTRSHVGVPGDTPVAGGSTIELTVAGHGGVPANGARAVVLNVTATGAGGSGWVTVWPSGQNKPLASNLNLGYVGQTIPNQVIVPLGDGGAIELFAKVTTHLVADVAGYFTDATTSAAGRFIPSAPTRLLDTRFANGVATTTRPGAGSVTTVQLAGRGPVPASGVAAVVVNITATDSAAAGYVTVWPSDLPRPLASSLNLDRAGQTIANHVVVPVSGDGRISLFSQSGTHLVADVEGYFTDGSAGTSSVGLYVPLRPARVLDTRTAVPEGTGPWPAADGLLVLPLAGRGGIAALGVGAVVANVTATGGLGAGWVTAFPAATVQPNASNLNVEFAGQTIPNLVTVTVGPSELVDLYTKAGTHLVADVAGYYTD